MGTNVSTNYINAPLDPKKTLCIKLPFPIFNHRSSRSWAPMSPPTTSMPPSTPRRPCASNSPSRYSIIGPRDHGHQCLHQLHQCPPRPQEDPVHQTPLPGHDYQELEEILHFRGLSP